MQASPYTHQITSIRNLKNKEERRKGGRKGTTYRQERRKTYFSDRLLQTVLVPLVMGMEPRGFIRRTVALHRVA